MKGISFDAVVGMLSMTAALICLALGIYVNESYIIYAGYASAIGGSAMLIWTLLTKAYVGTILAPFMWLSMVIMAIAGTSLIFQPLTAFAQQYISNYYQIVFYTYLVIYGLAILHLITHK